jgi:hypothetical protein
MRIKFLWAKIDNDPCVRDCSIGWDEEDFSASHDKNRVGTLLSRFIVALRHTAEIFAKSGLPYFHLGGVVH